MWNSRKCKQIYNRKEFDFCLGREVRGRKRPNFLNDEFTHYLDCGISLIGVYMHQNLLNCVLLICIVYFNKDWKYYANGVYYSILFQFIKELIYYFKLFATWVKFIFKMLPTFSFLFYVPFVMLPYASSF